MVRHDRVDELEIELFTVLISRQQSDISLKGCTGERSCIDLLARSVLLDSEDTFSTHGFERVVEAANPREEVDEGELVLFE